MRFSIFLLLAATFACAMLSPVSAQSTIGPNGYQCIVRHPVSARRVVVVHVQEDDDFQVTAQVRKGVMTIVYGNQFQSMPALFQRLAQHHECGHFDLPTRNEYLANCYALRRLDEEGLLTAANTRLIRDEQCGVGDLTRGGSGTSWWEETRKLCSDLNLPPCPGS